MVSVHERLCTMGLIKFVRAPKDRVDVEALVEALVPLSVVHFILVKTCFNYSKEMFNVVFSMRASWKRDTIDIPDRMDLNHSGSCP